MPPFVPRKRQHTPPQQDIPTPRSNTRPKPTLFDTLDAEPNITRRRRESEYFLQDTSSDSALSELSTSELEDDVAPGPSKRLRIDDAEDEDMDCWEDALTRTDLSHAARAPAPSGDLEITLGETAKPSLTNPHGKPKGPSRIERKIRIHTHCMHVQFLLFHNWIRNAWACDKEVQNLLVEQLTPGMKKEVERWRSASGVGANADVSNSAAGAKALAKRGRGGAKVRSGRDWGPTADKLESGMPNLSRGDPLIRLLKILSAFWRKRFKVTTPGLRKQGYQQLSDLEALVSSFQRDEHDPEQHGERVRNVAEFREHAKSCQGSRDLGNQLYTALLRGLGLEARMVSNLQPVGFGWSKVEDALRKKKSSARHVDKDQRRDGASDEETEGVVGSATEDSVSSSFKAKRTLVHGKSQDSGDKAWDISRSKVPPKQGGRETVSDDSDGMAVIDLTRSTPRTSSSQIYDKDLAFPIYWTEVLSPITNQWLPVEPITLNVVASTPELVASFEPRGAKAETSKQVIAYVVAYNATGTARDVTVRYLKHNRWPGKTKGFRMPIERLPVYNHKGKIKKYEDSDWFKTVMSGYTRQNLDEEHDLVPANTAPKPKERGESLQSYKSSAEFILERHFKREEVIRPEAKHVKIFKSGKGEKSTEEKVFRRTDVVTCKTVESWHKEGRSLKPGEQPVKMVPARASTLSRKRALRQIEAEGGTKAKQGLYSLEQTDWIIPDPIQDGVIPRNAYGNIDVFVESMVPQGAIHLPYRGTAKICSRLGISYAEAVTGFDFKSQRAVPVVEGVVIAQEHEQRVMDEWVKDEAVRVKKERLKKEKVILGLWKKFAIGLRVKDRVRKEYGGDDAQDAVDHSNPFTNRKYLAAKDLPGSERNGESNGPVLAHHDDIDGEFFADDDLGDAEAHEGGGFVVDDESRHDLEDYDHRIAKHYSNANSSSPSNTRETRPTRSLRRAP